MIFKKDPEILKFARENNMRYSQARNMYILIQTHIKNDPSYKARQDFLEKIKRIKPDRPGPLLIQELP